MSHPIAQCPQCKTSFSVTAEQLDAAGGSVRCGSCLHVFNAHDHTIENPTDNDDAFDSIEQEFGAELFGDESSSDDLEKQTTKNLDTFDDLDSWEEDPGSIFDDLAEMETLDLEDSTDDESWAEELINELEAESNDATEASSSHEKHADSTATESDPTEYLDPEALLTEEADQNSSDSNDSDDFTPVNELDEIDEENQEFDFNALNQTEPNWDIDPIIAPAATQIMPRSGPSFLQRFLLVAAVAGLIVQFFIYNFDSLARQEKFRPALQTACEWLSCSIPPQIDMDKLKASNLIVRTHPSEASALIIDVIITNHAGFKQPYPSLDLTFTNLDGNVVANRIFKPSEYLRGEVAGSQRMPSQTPVHISLEIVDPGKAAINYFLNLNPPILQPAS